MKYANRLATAVAGLALVATTAAHAAENEVVVIPMIYGDMVYAQRDDAQILPCNPPNTPVSGGGVSPRVEGYANNEPVFTKAVRDPRLKLVEDPTAEFPSERVDATEFTLYLPWTNEYEELRFFSDADHQEADVVVDLAAAISAYRDAGGREQEASCQHPEQLRAGRAAIDTDARIDEGLSKAESDDSE